jgi:hypothetical protein
MEVNSVKTAVFFISFHFVTERKLYRKILKTFPNTTPEVIITCITLSILEAVVSIPALVLPKYFLLVFLLIMEINPVEKYYKLFTIATPVGI